MAPLSEAVPARPTDVRVAGLRKSYGAVVAVGGIDLEIGRDPVACEEGEGALHEAGHRLRLLVGWIST